MKSASIKAKGREAEKAVVKALTDEGLEAERRRQEGINDRGDIAVAGVPGGVVIEVKDWARLCLPAWLAELEEEIAHAGAETGVVVHKRRGTTNARQWFATMPFWRYIELMKRIK